MSAADDPQEWISKAREDLLCIDNNLAAAQIPWNAVAFHAQQAAEKALKAYLVSRGETLDRVHDLPFLLNRCRGCGTSLIGLDADCNLLTRYAVQFRYPADVPDITDAEGRAASDAARRVVDAVVPLL
jgi:HEPN domain-containing protein